MSVISLPAVSEAVLRLWDRVWPFEVMTRKEYARREFNAYELGVDAGRSGLADHRRSATPAAVNTMRMVAESTGQDLDALAVEHDVDLEKATMGQLNRLGREIAKGMEGVTSIGVSLPVTSR